MCSSTYAIPSLHDGRWLKAMLNRINSTMAVAFSVVYRGVGYNLYTIFCRINVMGAEAENEPSTFSDFNEINSGNILNAENSKTISVVVSDIWSGKIKSRWVHLFKTACLFSTIRLKMGLEQHLSYKSRKSCS